MVPTKFDQKYEAQLDIKALKREDSLLSLSSDDGHTIGQNYEETVAMVKQFIMVDVPKTKSLNYDLI